VHDNECIGSGAIVLKLSALIPLTTILTKIISQKTWNGINTILYVNVQIIRAKDAHFVRKLKIFSILVLVCNGLVYYKFGLSYANVGTWFEIYFSQFKVFIASFANYAI